MNRAADAILAEQIPSSSSPFATSAQAFPPQKTHFLSPKKMDPRPLTFFSLFFTLPFLMEELLLLKSSCQLLTSFQVENWSCHIPPRIGISPNSGVPSTLSPRCHLGFRSSTPFSYTDRDPLGTGGGRISREFPSGEHLKSDRAGAASIHPSIAVGRTTKPVGAGGRGRQCSGL